MPVRWPTSTSSTSSWRKNSLSVKSAASAMPCGFAGCRTTRRSRSTTSPYQPELDPRKVKDLATLAFVEAKANVALLGPPGVGKTHLAVALAVAACRAGYTIYFTTLDDMVRQLKAADSIGRLASKLRTYLRPNVLVVDEDQLTPQRLIWPSSKRPLASFRVASLAVNSSGIQGGPVGDVVYKRGAGLEPSLWGALLGALACCVFLYGVRSRVTFFIADGSPGRTRIFGWRLGTFVAISITSVASIVFCFIFPLLNGVENYEHFISLSEVKKQFHSGVFPLLLTSLLFSGALILRALKGARALRKGSLAGLGGGPRWPQLRMTVFTMSIFSVALATLWLVYVRNPPGVFVVLSWLFTFFADDWLIISDYAMKTGSRETGMHAFRMRAATFLLLAALFWAIWRTFQYQGVIFFAYFAFAFLAFWTAESIHMQYLSTFWKGLKLRTRRLAKALHLLTDD